MDVPILLSINSNDFQALIQELKSQRMIRTTFMEEMKQQQSQSILENLRQMGKPRKKVASKLGRQYSNKLRG